MNPANDDGAYRQLRAAILALDVVPGERLTERGLESVLSASRTPIRAALMRLENEGLTRREGRGWQVTPIDLTEVRAVMEYREAVERAAVALAAERATGEELDALCTLADANRDQDDEETGLRDASDFHVALARLSRNHFFADAMAGALTRLFRARWLLVRTKSRDHGPGTSTWRSPPRSGPGTPTRRSPSRSRTASTPATGCSTASPRNAAACAAAASPSSSPRPPRSGRDDKATGRA